MNTEDKRFWEGCLFALGVLLVLVIIALVVVFT